MIPRSVVLSAGEHRAEKTGSLGIGEFVQRPIEPGHLLRKIESCCFSP